MVRDGDGKDQRGGDETEWKPLTIELERKRVQVGNWLLIFPLPRLTVVCARRIHATAAQSFSSSKVIPPVAKKVRHEMEMFGDIRVDDYYWLRDDSHSNPEILSYLKAENDYTNQSMSSELPPRAIFLYSFLFDGPGRDPVVFLMSLPNYFCFLNLVFLQFALPNYPILAFSNVIVGVKQFEDQLYTEMVARTKKVDDISAPIRRGSYYYYERTLVGKDYKLHCRRLITNDASPPSVYDVMPTGPGAPAEHVILDENIKAQGHEHYYFGAFLPSPNNKLIAYAEDTKGDGNYTVYVIDADKGTAIGNPLKGVTSNIEWVGDDALVYITSDESHSSNKYWCKKMHERHRPGRLFSGYVAIYEMENALQKVTVYSLPQMGEEIGPLQNVPTLADLADPASGENNDVESENGDGSNGGSGIGRSGVGREL
ncbi:hypothetical protein KSP39_PZI011420 [Platanthera zijinensis]|uniref:Peptidase S9A N-terminal domain-containing protein n=1 Tax=Platanthera zijinensis TaxID=2320716 RepID=A0AAP0BIF8_9ASPA